MDTTKPSMTAPPLAAGRISPALSEIDGQGWRVVDFISDLHLQSSQPTVFQGLREFLQHTPAQALFILGDLFELWVGDDAIDHAQGDFARECVHILKAASLRMAIYLLPGNRDFLLGEHFFKRTGIQSIADPCVLQSQTQRYLLSHGDALCTSDLPYQAFRQTVRSSSWQAQFLALPLLERLEMAQQMRAQSKENQHAQRQRSTQEFFDLDLESCRESLQAHHCTTLIHGHTHRPMEHDLGDGLVRVVLSDWDPHASPKRLEVVRLQHNRLERLSL